MILRIISNVNGYVRRQAAGVFRDFYLLTDEDIQRAPQFLPWSLLIDYQKKVASAADILDPLGLNTHMCYEVLSPDSIEKDMGIGKVLERVTNVCALLPAQLQKKEGKVQYRFLLPWAYSVQTKIRDYRRVKVRKLRNKIKDFFSHSIVQLILDGKPCSICTNCDRLLLAATGECIFPQTICLNRWRTHAR